MAPNFDLSEPVSVPRIRTERLWLREYRVSDFDAFAANLADPEARAHAGGVLGRRDAWRQFSSATGAWMLHGTGWWAVERLAEPGLVGTVGVFHRDGFPDHHEIGWVTLRPFWGQGFAKEAARAAVDFAFGVWGAERVVAHIDADNKPSLRVARAIGLTFQGDVDFYDTHLTRHVVDRPSRAG